MSKYKLTDNNNSNVKKDITERINKLIFIQTIPSTLQISHFFFLCLFANYFVFSKYTYNPLEGHLKKKEKKTKV